MKKSKQYILRAFVCLWIPLAGCLSQPQTPPGYLVVGLESSPGRLDPRYATDANSVRIGALVFNSLVRADENSRLQPDLAERWEAVDERTYLFHLRNGVTFHNGKPLTAADVKYTYDSVLDPATRSPKRGPLQTVEAVEILGRYLIRFRLTAPHAPFLENATLGIVPVGSPPVRGLEVNLIGSGPFTLEEHVPGEKVVLKSNPVYWEGPPQIAGIVFRVIPDAIVRVLEFKKGTVDFVQNDIEPDMLPWLESHTDAAVKIDQGTTFQYIGTNLDHPVLRLREVRQAIAHAVDREAVIRHLLKGLGTGATGLLSPAHWAYEPRVPQYRFDPEQAKRLLDQAGFPDPDGDGPLPRFTLSYKTTTLDLRRRIAEAFKEHLRRVGIELEVRTYEWGTFYEDIKKGNFHLYSLAWVGVTDPDIYYNLFHSDSFPPNGDNRGRYRNRETDALLERGRRSLVSAERKRIYSQVQHILARDLPYIPLWWTKNVVVMNPTIRGFIPYPDGELISLKKASFSAAKPPV
ncbi:MAG: ABC transporter substrate-binding protein [Deltaproteobacteria bacterium]|nr:ABC transporter substrate-binding protein [Deltaproteobacteria bacterium]